MTAGVRVMRALALLFAAALAALGLAAVLALAAALQSEPSVTLQPPPDPVDAARAMSLLRMHDPRRPNAGALAVAVLGERDLELLLNHVAQRWLGTPVQVDVEAGAAVVHASLHVPGNPFGRWLNVQMRLVQTGALPVLQSMQLGRLPLPAWVAERAVLAAAEHWGVRPEIDLAADVVQRVDFEPRELRVVYAWRSDSADRVAAALVSPADVPRLRAYSDRLGAWAERRPGQWTASLAAALGPVFETARERSAAPAADAAAENRAALVVLALYVNGRGVDTLLPQARGWPRPRPLRLLLDNRDDFAMHLLVSAALAATGSGPLSQAIGIYKEVADAHGGSGFSFNDIAADRAGTRLGELALADPVRLQTALARGVQERDFMPPVADLPEFLSEAEFVRRYGGVGAPGYTAMLAEIDRRVAALRVLSNRP